MREVAENIWDYLGQGIIAITTNGSLTRDNKAIPGRGVAGQAAERFPGLFSELGQRLRSSGNHVHLLSHGLVSFPVEETPWSQPDLRLIRRSAEELRSLADRHGWSVVLVPRPGCGGGGLRWDEVRPLLETCFDDRFIVVAAPERTF